MDQKKTEEKVSESELEGEKLLEEYFEQDKDDKHNMGYGVYGQTTGGDCCC